MIPRIIIRAGMQLIDDRKCRIEEAIEFIKNYSLQEAIDWLSRIYAFLWKDGAAFNKEVQLKLANGLCKGRLKRKIFENHKILYNIYKGAIVLFDEVQVLNAVKLAIIHCEVRPLPVKPSDSNKLARALMIINDHLNKDKTDDSSKEGILRNLLPEMLFRDVNYVNTRTVARWEYMFYDIPNKPNVKESQRYPNVAAWFKEATGISIQTHRALVMGMLSIFQNMINSRDLAKQSIIANWNTWKKDYVLKNEEEAHISTFCCDSGVLKSQFVQNLEDAEAPYFFLPLRQKPVVKIGDGLWCAGIRFLYEKMSIGIYHELFTRFREKRDDDKRNRLSAFLGEMFELYTLDILKYAYSSNSSIQIHRLDECDKTNKRKCDFAFLLDKNLVLIECKSHLFTQESSVQANIEKFKSEIKTVVLEGGNRIKTTIDRIESGNLLIPGIASSDINSYAPIILTLQYIPVNKLTSDIIDESLLASGLNTLRNKSTKLQLIDIATLENLAPHIVRGLSLVNFIRDLILDEEKINDKLLSAGDFFAFKKYEFLPNQFLEPIEKRIIDTTWSFWEERKKSK
jgi:hypothetical protein